MKQIGIPAAMYDSPVSIAVVNMHISMETTSQSIYTVGLWIFYCLGLQYRFFFKNGDTHRYLREKCWNKICSSYNFLLLADELSSRL